MTAPIVRGYDGMTLTATRKGWSRKDGETIIDLYAGPLAKAEALYASLKMDTAVTSLDLDPDAPSCKLTVTRPDPDAQTNETDNAIWELEAVEVMKDIRSHPYFNQSLVLATDIARIDKAIENGTAMDYTGHVLDDVLKRYYALRERGVESYYDSALRLTRTLIVGSASQLALSYASMNRVVSIDSINPPSALLGALTQLPILSYNGEDPTSDLTITSGNWEWLKKGPKCRSQGRDKFQLIQDWFAVDKWSEVFYGGTWDPIAT